MASKDFSTMPRKKKLRKLRIFAACPSNLAIERARLVMVVEDLKDLAEHVGVILESVDWRQVVPDLGRPQQIILDQLEPDTWDVFIGILWHRFGTPPKMTDSQTGKTYLSGTEEEFRIAYRLWQQYKRPRVMFYLCKRNPPFDDIDTDQFRRVKDFFAGFAPDADHPGLYQTFDSVESFERLVRQNLTNFLLQYAEQVNQRSVSPQEVQSFIATMPDMLPRRAAFFGREKEMEKVLRALSPDERGWGVVIDGIGGIGKTAVAVEAAYRCKQQKLFDAFIFVSAKQKRLEPSRIRAEARATTTLDEFVNETAHALGQPYITKLADDHKIRTLFDALRKTRVLLIYDNLETLTKEEQEALADWLRFLPQSCKAILTSRRRGGEGALWLRLEALDWETARAIIQHESARQENLRETLEHAGEGRWREMHEETGGSPLALIWTLGLMRTRGLPFDRALEMLKQGASLKSPLQKFIYKEARKELGAGDVAVLNALSFFFPSATFEALMAVADLSRTALETVLERLDSLSLVNRELGAERYSLHPLTRNYVRDDLLADEQMAYETGMRFARYWVDYAKKYGGYDKESYKTFDRLETEWANMDTISRWLWETAAVKGDRVGNNDAARYLVDLTSSLSFFLSYSGRWDEFIKLSERSYFAAYTSDTWRNAGWRAFDVAWLNYKRARIDDASYWLEKCVKSWERGGTKGDEASALRLGGLIAQQRKEYDKAEELLQKALNIRRSLGANREVAFALNSLGQLARERKQYNSAEQYYRDALELAREIDDKVGQAIFIGNLGELAINRRQWIKALDLFEQALPLAQQVGSIELIADSKYGIARAWKAEGRADPELVLQFAQEALAIYERLQHRDFVRVKKFVVKLTKAFK
jgi:tetratricopeptide (TPR) repeat protein